jgi:hypothetical protein
MRRALVSLLAAALLTAAAVVPVAASGPTSPSLSLGVCYYATGDDLLVTLTWANLASTTADLIVTDTFSQGKKLPAYSLTLDFTAPVLANSYSPDLIQLWQLPGVTAWNSITSVGASATGAFAGTAKAVKQPHGGWALCP